MRQSWIDRWRGILIFQIVMFHVLGVAIQTPDATNEFLTAICNWIERYHVVAFFAVMGIVWRRKDSIKEFLFGKIRRLLMPYFIFGCLWAVCFIGLACGFHGSYTSINRFSWWQPFLSVVFCNGYPDGIGARVVNALWFLPSMFGVSLAYYVVDCFLPKRTHQLLLLLPLYAFKCTLAGLNWPWDVNRIPYFMMFVIVARWTIPRSPFQWIINHRIYGVMTAIVLYAAAEARPSIRFCFDAMGIGAWAWFFDLMMMISASAILAQSVQWQFLETVGKASLGILVMHKFPILVFQTLSGTFALMFGNKLFGVFSAFLLSSLVVIACVTVTCIIRRIVPFALGERRRAHEQE